VKLKYKGFSPLFFPFQGVLSYNTKLHFLINHLPTKDHPMIDTFKPNQIFYKSVAPLDLMARVGSKILATVKTSVETTKERKKLKKG